MVCQNQGQVTPGLKRILGPFQKAKDWIVSGVATGARGGEALLVAGCFNKSFTKLQKELLDHVISQASLGIEKIHLADSAQSSHRSKAAFLANMSHEIRTPLNALIGFSEILIEEDKDLARRQLVAANIRKNGEYLTRLIDDVLDLSIVEAGDLKVRYSPTSLEKLFAEIRSVAKLKATEKGLNFDISIDGPLPRVIITDEVRLKQILLNLVGNAVKFTQQGSVAMSASWRRLNSQSPQLVIYIEDTGVGISEEAQGQLFRPFSQADETATRRYGGSGLGLALAARVADEMGAQLRLVRSIRGVGTVFEVIVQAREVEGVGEFAGLADFAPARRPNLWTGSPNLKGTKVLLVEDAVDNQEIFSHFLAKAGAEVSIVDNGASAIEAGTAGEFDLILMDIQIPVLDGKEATRQLRSAGFMKPIVALTAHAMREEQDTCLSAGCDGQITKPVCERDFMQAVHSFLVSSKLPRIAT